jgi:hypothetical protein
MAVGQTLADILGGLVAINRGDASGAQAFTRQGRADLAQQRQNQRAQQGMMAEVLQKAQQDPQYNAMLQQALAPFLQNEATRAGTAQTQRQTNALIPAQVGSLQANTENTRGQTTLQKPEFRQRERLVDAQVGNLGASTEYTRRQAEQVEPEMWLKTLLGEAQVQNLEAQGEQTRKQTSQMDATLRNQTGLANAQIGNLGANTQATQQNTAGSVWQQRTQQAKDLLANNVGFPGWDAMVQFMQQGQRDREFRGQQQLGQRQIAAGMFGQMLPDYRTGGMTPDQRNVAQQAGVQLPEPGPDPRQAAMAQELQAAMQRMGQKKQRPQSKQGQRQSNKVEQKPKVLEPLNKMNYMRFPEWPYDIWGNPKQPQPEVEMLPLETIQQMLQHLANSQG